MSPQSSNARKILFLAYYFPPLGGAGSQRTLKFVKYLPGHGFQPSVLAGELANGDRWAPADQAMCAEIGSGIRVDRVSLFKKPFASKWRRSLREFLGMNSEFGSRWFNEAVSAGRRICAEEKPELIFATMSPFESSEVAECLSQEFGIPWIADLRDPWALDEWQVHPSRWHRHAKRREMGRKLKSASLVIMNTPEASKRIQATFPGLRMPVISITNGYDSDDFSKPLEIEKNDCFTIVHAGALHTALGFRQQRHGLLYRLLGRSSDGVKFLSRSHVFLVKAIEKWIEEEPEIRKMIKLELLGVPAAADVEFAESSKASDVIEFLGYLSHEDSVSRVRQAGLLFLPMHELKSGDRATIVPGKTYEYLASGRPILGALPEGDCRDLLSSSGRATVCGPSDVDAMLEALKIEFRRWSEGGSEGVKNPDLVERFERAALTEQLAHELRKLLPEPPNCSHEKTDSRNAPMGV